MRVLLVTILLAAATPAGATMFFAAGFSGGYEKAVALDREDRVIGCRASARMADGLSVRLERWAGDAAPRLSLQSDRLYDIHMTPVDVVADGALYDLSPVGAGTEPSGLGPVTMRLSDEAAAALARARVAEIDAQGHRFALPPGLPAAMRFVARCGA